MNKYFILSIVCFSALQQNAPAAVPVIEIKDDDTKNIKHEKNTTLSFDKVFQTDQQGYEAMKKTFKNVVLWTYENENEILQTKLQESLKIINPKEHKIDVIFLKLQGNENLQVTHLGITTSIEEFQQLSVEDLASSIRDIISPQLKALQNEQDADKFLSGDDIKLLLVMESSHQYFDFVKEKLEEQIREGTYQEADIKDIKFIDTKIYKEYKQPSLLLYKPGYPIERYSNNITYIDQILDFVYLESLPLVVPLSKQYLARVFGGPIGTQFHFLMNEKNDQLIKEIEAVALNNKENDLYYERIIFTYSNFLDNEDLWTQFDFTKETKGPKLVVTRTNFRKFQLEKYIFDSSELNFQTITEFIEKFRSNQIQQFFRSETEPDTIDIDGIQKVVGSSFVSEVIKGKVNTLVLFWDSKDTKASQVQENLIRSLSAEIPEEKREFLKICTFDLALNEHPQIIIEKAPQLFLYLANDKRRPKDYNMELELDQFKAWLSYWVTDLELVEFHENGYTPIDYKKKSKIEALGGSVGLSNKNDL